MNCLGRCKVATNSADHFRLFARSATPESCNRRRTFPSTVLQPLQPPSRLHGRFLQARTLLGDEAISECIMDIDAALLRTLESKKSLEVGRNQAGSGDVKTSAEELTALLRQVSEDPTREIEKLINQLQKLHTQLQNAGNRIQHDIAQHAELSQQTVQLTAIISDSVKKLPDGTYHDRKSTGASSRLR